jgi:hypothetical protein
MMFTPPAPCACAAMPWRVMVDAADCNPAAARKCLGPLLPLLQRVLERYLMGLKAAMQPQKVGRCCACSFIARLLDMGMQRLSVC